MDKEKQREQMAINGIISDSKDIRSIYKKYDDKGILPLCKCGCGKPVSKRDRYPFGWNEYIIGHFNRTKHKYLESRDEIINPPLCLCGCGQEVNKNKRNKYKWNKFVMGHGSKGKKLEEIVGKEKAEFLKSKTSERFKGEKNHMNKPEHRKRQSDMMIDWEFYNKHGYKRSSVPYTDEFNSKLKKKIAERDSYTCQLCTELLPDKFGIHHIDYDKKNSNSNNLIFLCFYCHMKTNHNREFWQSHFESYQKERGFNDGPK